MAYYGLEEIFECAEHQIMKILVSMPIVADILTKLSAVTVRKWLCVDLIDDFVTCLANKPAHFLSNVLRHITSNEIADELFPYITAAALITKNAEIRKAVMKFCQARLSPPLIGQIVAEASLDAPEEYYRDVYDEYVERRKCLIDGLNRIPGVYSPIPMGAFYTVAKLPIDDSEKFCRWCLEEFEYEGETIMMAPASGFYTTPGAGKNQVRMAYVLKKDDLDRALIVLAKALEAYPGRVEDEGI